MRAAIRRLIPAVAILLLTAEFAQAQAIERVPVLIDTDIGTDIDDPFALALAFGSYELDVRGITTCASDPQKRAMMICRFLTMTGRRHTPIAAGAEPQPKRSITKQYPYYYHPDVLFDRTKKPEKETAVDFLFGRLKGQPGKITIVSLGPLTNIAQLLKQRPEAAKLIKQIILRESHLELDPDAAKIVFDSSIPKLVVSNQALEKLTLDAAAVKRVLSPGTQLTRQVETLYQLGDEPGIPLGDVVSTAILFRPELATTADKSLVLDDKGNLHTTPTNQSSAGRCKLVTAVDRTQLTDWYVGRMASLVKPEDRPVKPVAQGMMPKRVHVAEDYDNDIERRWWMSGKEERKILPTGSTRACRGVLTHDFDDLQMMSREMYTAVIFNPVPGPPMGKSPRLSFRYWLKGTDTLRVQIYSLTNGYHRHLVLKGLPQEKWQAATVDMTQARRPDGTGGPLGEGERIDDLQFYADPDSEIIIDDMVLYDAAAEGERRPFPKQVLFTGWFDSGALGREWPGEFEHARDQGYFWHAAKSIADKETGNSTIRLGLRGERILPKQTRLTFRYKTKSAAPITVKLRNRTSGATYTAQVENPSQEPWTQATVDFATAGPLSRPKNETKNEPKNSSQPTADLIEFSLPDKSDLLVDDVLLFEPGDQ